MSDVRKALEQTIYTEYESLHGKPMFPPECEGFASIILERFDVTPKPVVTDRQLGMHVVNSYGRMIFGDNPAESVEQRGAALRRNLAAAGLEIVKVTDAS